MNGQDLSFTTESSLSRRIALPKSSREDLNLALTMVKTRVGLEQRQESATPTGANDASV